MFTFAEVFASLFIFFALVYGIYCIVKGEVI